MFRGEDGPLKNEVEQLIDWLQAEVRPDIVHLSNVMLAGLARPLRERLGVPVIATLSGEDSFLEKLPAAVLCPGPGRVAGPGRGSGRTGGHVRILRRFHGRVSGRAAREDRRDPARVEPGRVPAGGRRKAEGGRRNRSPTGRTAPRPSVSSAASVPTRGCTCSSRPCMR